MKVVLTGFSGFVGRHLLPSLNEVGVSTVKLSLRDKWVELIPEQYDAIIHLAGKAHDTANTSRREEYYEVNTILTQRLFDHFIRGTARDFIYFSSVKAVADTVEGLLDEDANPNPRTPYGVSKWEAERYVSNHSLPMGKRLFIFRPCMIHGPGNKGNLNLLYNLVSKGLPWPLAAFENRRSFLSIANLQFVIKSILEDPDIPGGTYNLADDETFSTNELIKLIGASQGRKITLWRIPKNIVSTLARAGGLLRLPLNSERLKKLTESYCVDNNKIKSVLGIDRLPCSAKDGLLATLRSFN